uniref:BHLH transcription factor bHLH13.5 n=1 Tax=Gardenia jasminoides TaxID=114476 RepID=A0A6M4C9W8_GARJA|nr:bHLH transcription factor bHLH13.5 [Gardenia jasminoides]
MQPQDLSENLDLYDYLTGTTSFSDAGTYCLPRNYDFPGVAQTQSLYNNTSFYSLEMSDVTESSPEARALAASQQHKEAERRRRERINSHLDKLRTLLPCNTKTDKASLLAKVVQRVRELKQQTSEIMQLECFPSEADEISVMLNDNSTDGKLLMKASLCCEDRSDLIPDLNEILKSFHLSPLRAEMVTLGGRIRNVIILAGDKNQTDDESVPSLRDALRSLVQRSNYASGDRPKRRRVFDQGIVS